DPRRGRLAGGGRRLVADEPRPEGAVHRGRGGRGPAHPRRLRRPRGGADDSPRRRARTPAFVLVVGGGRRPPGLPRNATPPGVPARRAAPLRRLDPVLPR